MYSRKSCRKRRSTPYSEGIDSSMNLDCNKLEKVAAQCDYLAKRLQHVLDRRCLAQRSKEKTAFSKLHKALNTDSESSCSSALETEYESRQQSFTENESTIEDYSSDDIARSFFDGRIPCEGVKRPHYHKRQNQEKSRYNSKLTGRKFHEGSVDLILNQLSRRCRKRVQSPKRNRLSRQLKHVEEVLEKQLTLQELLQKNENKTTHGSYRDIIRYSGNSSPLQFRKRASRSIGDHDHDHESAKVTTSHGRISRALHHTPTARYQNFVAENSTIPNIVKFQDTTNRESSNRFFSNNNQREVLSSAYNEEALNEKYQQKGNYIEYLKCANGVDTTPMNREFLFPDESIRCEPLQSKNEYHGKVLQMEQLGYSDGKSVPFLMTAKGDILEPSNHMKKTLDESFIAQERTKESLKKFAEDIRSQIMDTLNSHFSKIESSLTALDCKSLSSERQKISTCETISRESIDKNKHAHLYNIKKKYNLILDKNPNPLRVDDLNLMVLASPSNRYTNSEILRRLCCKMTLKLDAHAKLSKSERERIKVASFALTQLKVITRGSTVARCRSLKAIGIPRSTVFLWLDGLDVIRWSPAKNNQYHDDSGSLKLQDITRIEVDDILGLYSPRVNNKGKTKCGDERESNRRRMRFTFETNEKQYNFVTNFPFVAQAWMVGLVSLPTTLESLPIIECSDHILSRLSNMNRKIYCLSKERETHGRSDDTKLPLSHERETHGKSDDTKLPLSHDEMISESVTVKPASYQKYEDIEGHEINRKGVEKLQKQKQNTIIEEERTENLASHTYGLKPKSPKKDEETSNTYGTIDSSFEVNVYKNNEKPFITSLDISASEACNKDFPNLTKYNAKDAPEAMEKKRIFVNTASFDEQNFLNNDSLSSSVEENASVQKIPVLRESCAKDISSEIPEQISTLDTFTSIEQFPFNSKYTQNNSEEENIQNIRQNEALNTDESFKQDSCSSDSLNEPTINQNEINLTKKNENKKLLRFLESNLPLGLLKSDKTLKNNDDGGQMSEIRLLESSKSQPNCCNLDEECNRDKKLTEQLSCKKCLEENVEMKNLRSEHLDSITELAQTREQLSKAKQKLDNTKIKAKKIKKDIVDIRKKCMKLENERLDLKNKTRALNNKIISMSSAQGRAGTNSVVSELRRISEGNVLIKATFNDKKNHSLENRFVKLDDFKIVVWTHDLNGKRNFKRNKSIHVKDIIRVDFGCSSFPQVWIARQNGKTNKNVEFPPWRCFSLIDPERSYDFIALNDDDAEAWVVGLGRLISAYSVAPNIQSRDEFLIKRAKMKLESFCKLRGISQLGLWKMAINSAIESKLPITCQEVPEDV